MSTYFEAPVQTERRSLSIASTVARLVLIGVALAVVAGAFAYLGAWLTPNNLTPARFTDALPEAPFMTGWGPNTPREAAERTVADAESSGSRRWRARREPGQATSLVERCEPASSF